MTLFKVIFVKKSILKANFLQLHTFFKSFQITISYLFYFFCVLFTTGLRHMRSFTSSLSHSCCRRQSSHFFSEYAFWTSQTPFLSKVWWSQFTSTFSSFFKDGHRIFLKSMMNLETNEKVFI